MPDLAEFKGTGGREQGTAGKSAVAVLERHLPGPTPAQWELRRRVLDAVSAPSTKLAYGHALDCLFRFLAGRPLDRALLQEWRASIDGAVHT